MTLQRSNRAFTIIEMLAVLAIMGLIAALAAPTLRNFRKGDSIASASRQMLDAVAHARQLAISQHTTVYMVFVPTNLWNTPAWGPNPDVFVNNLNAAMTTNAPQCLIAVSNVIDKQLTGYTFVSLRSIGDQPGNPTPRYLESWQTLPDGTFIPPWKFSTDINYTNHIVNPINGQVFEVGGFRYDLSFPFPTEDTFYEGFEIPLPYIAFDYLGRLVSEKDDSGNYHDAFIPLAQGSVFAAQNAGEFNPSGRKKPRHDRLPAPGHRDAPGNSTNTFNLVHVDWLTGRARLEHEVMQ